MKNTLKNTLKRSVGALVLTGVMLYSNGSDAQQLQQNNFYTQNQFSLNPAMAGAQGNIEVVLNYQDQWSGLKGAPETSRIGVNGLVSDAIGVGVNVEQNTSGVIKYNRTDLNFSYRIKLDDAQSLGFGMKMGFTRNSLNYDNVQVGNESDPLLYSSSIVDEILIYTGAGLHYNNKALNVHLVAPIIYNAQGNRTFQTSYMFASYDLFSKEKIWKFQPSAMYRIDARTGNQLDLNLMAQWNKRAWGMVSYRTSGSVLFNLGLVLKNVGIGYSFAVNGQRFYTRSSVSNELMIRFEPKFSLTKKAPRYQNSNRVEAEY